MSTAANRSIRLLLPEPPSANRYWRHAKGRTYLAPEATAYRLAVKMAYYKLVKRTKIFLPDGMVNVHLWWNRGRKSGDLDNRIKQVLDALEGLAYASDSQVVEIHAYRHDARPDENGLVIIVEKNTTAAPTEG